MQTRALTREDLAALPNYVPGRSVPGAIKLASNEVPFGPLPGVIEALTEAASAVNRYPDMGVTALRDKLADRLGVDPERVVTGCGSVALAEHLARTTCLPGDNIVYSWRSFEAYPIIAATTAFLVLGGRRWMGDAIAPEWRWVLWIAPALVVVPTFQLWIHAYRVRFEGGSRRKGSP